MLRQTDLRLLVGKQVKATGSCGMGKGREITGTLRKGEMGYYEVLVKDEKGWEMPYSVYTQSIEEVK